MSRWQKLIHGVRERYFVESKTHDALGREKPDPTPMELPVGFKRQPTIHEIMQMYLRSDRAKQVAEKIGAETLEDAQNFGPDDDDPLPNTPHEVHDMVEEQIAADVADYARRRREALAAQQGGEKTKDRVKDQKSGEEPKGDHKP